jgi:transcription elongation factor GreA
MTYESTPTSLRPVVLTQAELDQLVAEVGALQDEAQIAQLERVIALATVVDGARTDDGAAGLGSIVRVEDEARRALEYEIVSVRSQRGTCPQVTPASPVGQALLGARPGDTVSVMLPNGRARSLAVLAVCEAP